MEEVKTRSLKAEFSVAVAVTLLAILLASALTVWGCWRVRRWLLPNPDMVALYIGEDGATDREGRWARYEIELDGKAQPITWISDEWSKPDLIEESDLLVGEAEFSIKSIEPSIAQLNSRQLAVYTAAGVLMGVLPVLFFIAGVLLCAIWFYRKRLAPAISALDDATRHISRQDLDFAVACPVHNELGRLCGSFDQMRRALYDNNLKLWRSIEERRTMQASVAHDLRNPLAIMEGTLEHLRALAHAGELTGDRLDGALESLTVTAKRMERYTDYIRDLSAIEDTEITMTQAVLPDFLRGAAESVGVLAEARDLAVDAAFDVPECRIELDREIFYRTLENVFSNAVRYAGSCIELTFELHRETLLVRLSDDGPGFSAKMLKKKSSLYYSEDASGEHMGLGLATGRILCELHGGGLRIMNRPEGGATVELTLAVKRI